MGAALVSWGTPSLSHSSRCVRKVPQNVTWSRLPFLTCVSAPPHLPLSCYGATPRRCQQIETSILHPPLHALGLPASLATTLSAPPTRIPTITGSRLPFLAWLQILDARDHRLSASPPASLAVAAWDARDKWILCTPPPGGYTLDVCLTCSTLETWYRRDCQNCCADTSSQLTWARL